mgnify:CR=1 FL=1
MLKMGKTSEEVVSEEASKALMKIEGEASGKDILDRISSFCDANDFMLYGLMGAGIIKEKIARKRIKDYKFVIDKEKTKDIQLLRGLLFGRTGAASTQEEFNLVASFPPQGEFMAIKGFENLYPRLVRLLISAENRISMVNPFFDKEGIGKIMPYIKGVAERGVKIRIVTRPKHDASPEQETQLSQMVGELGEMCQLKRFGGAINGKPYHLHAKFMVSDSKSAYVGSANITETSLGNNVEVGIIFSGARAKSLSAFFSLMWKNSTEE